MRKKLNRSFYIQPTLNVAKKLLGKYIVRKIGAKKLSGKIIETEAYIGPQDKAAHSYKGKITSRNKIEYLSGGRVYIYLVYGMYWQLNITTSNKGKPECVLIRAIDPDTRDSQRTVKGQSIANGPGKLCRYLKLDKSFYGEDLTKSERIWLEDRGEKVKASDILNKKRIGIDYAGPYWSGRKWRFIIKKEKRKKVVVAMSGGVDSSVAAALLKEAGYDVVGVFMKLDGLKSSKKNEIRTRRIAKKIGVSFKVLNLRKAFREEVIKPFVKEYKKGRTPNPCVVCNKKVKFNFLLKELKKLKADFIATGHYARIKIPTISTVVKKVRHKGLLKLLKGKDKGKDQSYFLWQLSQKILRRVLFPIGGYKKSEVEKLAREFKLPVSNMSESQEICFVEKTTEDFLKKHIKMKPGKIIDKNKKIIGKHQGVWFYTIGQRKGIKLAGGPYWVLGKDIKKNLLIVTKKERDLSKKELIAGNINWISGKAPRLPLKIKSKIRYRHKLASALIVRQKRGKVKVVFLKAQRAITPGQSVVFYSAESGTGNRQELLGGGIIYK